MAFYRGKFAPTDARGRRHGNGRIGAALALAVILGAPAPSWAADEQSALALDAISQSTAPARTAEDDDAIVVTGSTDAKPSEVRRQANRITRNSVKFRTPLAMFQDKVCPGVVGMPVDLAEIMVERIRNNAETVGLKTATAGDCQPNILVIFVRNGQATVKQLLKDKSYLLGEISVSDQNELIADSGPVHAWTNTVVKSRQGDLVQGDKRNDATKLPVLNVAQSQSHIFLANRLDITNSVVMIDLEAVDGMGVVQIADYVTMRAFAQTQPIGGNAASSTILSLFDPDPQAAHPYEMTDFDRAYLSAVYDGVDSLNAASKLASINVKLREIEIVKASGETTSPE